MKVTVIGGATIDIVVTEALHNDDLGAKRDVESITMGIGGGAVNASLAFHASDAHVRIVCALGGDAEAEWVRAALGREGIDLSLVQLVASVPTGKAVIHLDRNAEAKIFAERGASTRVSPARALDAIGRSELLYVTALSAEAEVDFEQALARSSQRLPRFAFNPGMRQLHAASPSLQQLMKRANFVSMNEAEVRLWASRQGAALPDDLRLGNASWMSALREHDSQAWLVTLGARGALFHDGARLNYSEGLRIPVRSTLGAGDAFGATLVRHWAAGTQAPEALEAACAYSAKVLMVAAANLAR